MAAPRAILAPTRPPSAADPANMLLAASELPACSPLASASRLYKLFFRPAILAEYELARCEFVPWVLSPKMVPTLEALANPAPAAKPALIPFNIPAVVWMVFETGESTSAPSFAALANLPNGPVTPPVNELTSPATGLVIPPTRLPAWFNTLGTVLRTPPTLGPKLGASELVILLTVLPTPPSRPPKPRASWANTGCRPRQAVNDNKARVTKLPLIAAGLIL